MSARNEMCHQVQPIQHLLRTVIAGCISPVPTIAVDEYHVAQQPLEKALISVSSPNLNLIVTHQSVLTLWQEKTSLSNP
jgi:hypothetical protein